MLLFCLQCATYWQVAHLVSSNVAGSGKSMRAKRLQALLPEGWVKGSGSSSAKVRKLPPQTHPLA